MDEFEYCTCKDKTSVTIGFEDDFGYWYVCTKCGKRIKDNYRYYNHYDGEDHEVFMDYDGDVIIDRDDDE